MEREEYLAMIQASRASVWTAIRQAKQDHAAGSINADEMQARVEYGEALLDMLDEMEKEANDEQCPDQPEGIAGRVRCAQSNRVR